MSIPMNKPVPAQLPGWQWLRTCQECGHQQEDAEPAGDTTAAYDNRACKKCRSEALDYGSSIPVTDEAKAKQEQLMEQWFPDET